MSPQKLLWEQEHLAQAPGPPTPTPANSTEPPMPLLSQLSQSCRPALPSRAWARCCDPSQAGVGLHSTRRQGPRAPRWQLCGQLNGSSVPFLALHLLQEAPALTLGGGAQRSHPQDRDQELQQRCLLGGWQDKHLPWTWGTPIRPAFPVVPGHVRRQATQVWESCLCRFLTPLLHHDLLYGPSTRL